MITRLEQMLTALSKHIERTTNAVNGYPDGTEVDETVVARLCASWAVLHSQFQEDGSAPAVPEVAPVIAVAETTGNRMLRRLNHLYPLAIPTATEIRETFHCSKATAERLVKQFTENRENEDKSNAA
jgi:hypothetical protein